MRIPGLLAPSTTPGSVVFHGVTPGLRNIVLMGNPDKQIHFHQNGILTPEDLVSCSAIRNHEKLGKAIAFKGYKETVFTLRTVEHSEAISVMMTKELSKNDRLMLLNQIQVQLVEFRCVPLLPPFLLKETWRDVADYVDLVEKKFIMILEI